MELNGGECHTPRSKTGKQQCAMLKLLQTLVSVSERLKFITLSNISCFNFAYDFMIFQSINNKVNEVEHSTCKFSILALVVFDKLM